MKKLFILLIFIGMAFLSLAQSESCAKSSCGPEGTKKNEAAAITTMRDDLQTVITKLAKSGISIDKEVSQMQITKGTSDDESLLFISQAALTVRHELINKVDPSRLITSLREYKPGNFSTKQQMFLGLKKEIEILATQAEAL
jgi:hypothetical protein